MPNNFKNINGKIQSFLAKKRGSEFNLNDKEYKLPLSDAFFCAEDTIKNKVFFYGIEAALTKLKTITNNIIVVDAGSGTGVLGALALFLGANKCYFLENNPYSLKINQQLIEYLGYIDQSEFIECDACKINLPETFDLLISETITSGFVNEDFLQIITNLKKYKNKHSIIIPSEFKVIITEKDANEQIVAKQNIAFNTLKNTFKQNKFSKQTKIVNYKTEVCLYDDVWVKSGDCMSFINQITINC